MRKYYRAYPPEYNVDHVLRLAAETIAGKLSESTCRFVGALFSYPEKLSSFQTCVFAAKFAFMHITREPKS